MSPMKARRATVEELLSVLMRRLSEYEAYFCSLNNESEKPDNASVTAFRHLVKLVHEIECVNEMAETEADRRVQGEDSASDVLRDVYGISSVPGADWHQLTEACGGSAVLEEDPEEDGEYTDEGGE